MAARSVSAAKFLVASISTVSRRGYAYAAASQGLGHASSGSRQNMMNDRAGMDSDNSWGPDPVTGYYRPMNRAAEIDVADLRNMVLKHRIRAN